MQPVAATVLTELKSFMQEAGALAISIQHSAERSEKADNSIVTEADLAISKLFQQRFAHYLHQPGHMLIDEEAAKKPMDEVLAGDYQWVIDPIDGTATYAGHGLFWGVILSVFRKGEPWLGAVYVPAMRLLYWADESHAYETTEAFTSHETTRTLEPVAMPFGFSTQVAVHTETYNVVFRKLHPIPFIPVDYWSPLNGAMVAAGRLRGTIAQDSVWDFGAAFVMATRLGYSLRRVPDGKVFTTLSTEFLKPDWRVSSPMFIGPDATFDGLNTYFE